MSAKKQNNRLEAVKDAATGYTVVILGIVCFIIALIVIMAFVRLVVGASIASNTANATAAGTTTTLAKSVASLAIGSV